MMPNRTVTRARRASRLLATLALLAVALGTTVSTGQPAGAAPSSVPGFAYVPNLFASSVSVVNLGTGTVVKSIPVPFPFGTAVAPDGSAVYATSLLDDSVAVISTATRSVATTITVGAYGTHQPNGVAVDALNTRLYVANSNTDTVSVVSISGANVITEVAVGDNPTGIAVAPNGLVYVANLYSNTVSVIDPVALTVRATIDVGTNPTGIDAGPGNRVFVANTASSTVSVIDTVLNRVMRTISLPSGATPEGIAVRGSTVAVSNVGTGGVVLLDAITGKTLATIALDGTWGIDLAPTGAIAATLPASDAVAIIQADKRRTTNSVTTANLPLGLGHFISPN